MNKYKKSILIVLSQILFANLVGFVVSIFTANVFIISTFVSVFIIFMYLIIMGYALRKP